MPLLSAVIRINEMMERLADEKNILSEDEGRSLETAKTAGGKTKCLS
jgi:hypothetical protein